MQKRHSSLSSAAAFVDRPQTYRKRSNSIPIMEALGCSTDEARLILDEGNAALRRRRSSGRNPSRRKRSNPEHVTTFRPQDHIQYLYPPAQQPSEGTLYPPDRSSLHSRTSSNMTDNSTSTITGRTPIAAGDSTTPMVSPGSPLFDYSANLANFIRAQLASIPSHGYAAISPRSCPDFSFPSKSPPQSPAKPKRSMPSIQMPSIRPPVQSQFSAWSSTDDDETDDELSSFPAVPGQDFMDTSYPSSVLDYDDELQGGSFLFPSTPPELALEHPNIGGFEFPAPPPKSPPSPYSSHDEVHYQSSVSDHPKLTPSSAPSFSSSSTTSYFDSKRPISISAQMKDRIIAAVSPHPGSHKMFRAISPFENGAISNVHDIHVESQHRVVVDGLSFDLLHDLKMPDETMTRVSTPC
ncbi:hypothetical protein P154DRAFT_273141 [Amniculicola lignicola CBS 123094]|uniref:Uncharacterized protein n=1 Tax=Amniculicola lignicola CBS 123094 TaxID=1392246 RepID=A0A6A5W7E8_9PLEO|nr:hypothetical protein P154DRAFT_273141 [Amniculicola lignicola CBS 123094]